MCFTKYEPYKSMNNDINVYGVLKPSQESGVDEPRANIFKNSILNTTFSTSVQKDICYLRIINQ